jgi:pre-mRNA-splicing factor ISY1
MARNQEKAQSMLNRYLAGRNDDGEAPARKRRPYLASECHDLNEADKWRQQILRDIGRKVLDIQNEGLGEARTRDLNDEINKLMREKSHWERRIVELGGPNYAKTAPKITDSRGRVVAEASGRGAGYRYFGAAKNLPGVRELFERHDEAAAGEGRRRTRGELHRRIDGDYYGFRDEEDGGAMVTAEAAAEATMRAEEMARWEAEAPERERAGAEAVAAAAALGAGGGEDGGSAFTAYVPLPEPKEIEAKVLEAKKAALLNKYMSESLAKEQEEARVLLNRG